MTRMIRRELDELYWVWVPGLVAAMAIISLASGRPGGLSTTLLLLSAVLGAALSSQQLALLAMSVHYQSAQPHCRTPRHETPAPSPPSRWVRTPHENLAAIFSPCQE
mgnify:CR=1 FL=1